MEFTLLNHQTTEFVDSQRERSWGRNVEVKALLVTFPLLYIYVSFWMSSNPQKSAVMCWWSPSRSAEVLGSETETQLHWWDVQSPPFWLLQGQHSSSCEDGHCSWSRLLGLTSFTCMKWKGCRAGTWIIVIYSFRDKCAHLSDRNKGEIIIKVVRVKNSP